MITNMGEKGIETYKYYQFSVFFLSLGKEYKIHETKKSRNLLGYCLVSTIKAYA